MTPKIGQVYGWGDLGAVEYVGIDPGYSRLFLFRIVDFPTEMVQVAHVCGASLDGEQFISMAPAFFQLVCRELST